MNDLNLTLTGWVATEPHMVVRRDGSPTDMCTFRMAQTPRRFNPAVKDWRDAQTEWFTVRVHRDAAYFVERSVAKGQPVVVCGRLRSHTWQTAEGESRTEMQLDATAVGHDLSRGYATFRRAVVDGSGTIADAGARAEDTVDVDADVDESEAELTAEEATQWEMAPSADVDESDADEADARVRAALSA